MLKKTRILVFFLFSIVSILLYIDNTNYYQGRGYGIISNTLPFNLKPVHWNWDLGNFGFRIEDNYGISIIANKSIIKSKFKSIEVDKIVEYGFNESEFISLVSHSNSKYSYIGLKQNNDKGGEYFKYEIYNHNNFIQQFNKSKFKWIKIENDIRKIRIYTVGFNYLLILLGIVLIFLLRRFILNYQYIKNLK